jgi:glutathione reductase (NADPH)
VSLKYDYIVIGGGSGGIASARRAAAHGAKTLLVEQHRLGGTCVNVGCVPKKVMWNTAQVAEMIRLAPAYGFATKGVNPFDLRHLKEVRDSYITRLNGIYADMLKNSGVVKVEGIGVLMKSDAGNHQVKVGGDTYRAPHTLLAVGGLPRLPAVPGAQLGITSDGFFDLSSVPGKILVVGAGYIADLGAKVTLAIRREGFLRSFDTEISNALMNKMTNQGIEILTKTEVHALSKVTGRTIEATLANGHKKTFDKVLWAIGRDPNTQELGLTNVGAKTVAGAILVDDFENVLDDQGKVIAGLYALGDVTGKKALTPVAIGAGRKLADRLFGGIPQSKFDYDDVPSVIFSHPPIGTVGLTEEGAVKKFGQNQVHVYRTRFSNMFYSITNERPQTLMKMITVKGESQNPGDYRIVGLHVLGMGADEMIQGFAVALKMGARKIDFDETVAIHPTAAEEFVTMT